MERALLLFVVLCSCSLRTARLERYQKEADQFNEASLTAALQAEGLTLLSAPPVTPTQTATKGYAQDKDNKKYLLTFSPQTVETKTFRLRGCPPGRGTPLPPIPEDTTSPAASEPTPESKTIRYAQRQVHAKYVHLGGCVPVP